MTQPLLVLEGVTKTYPGEVPVHALRGMSLIVHPGEHLAVMGPSGAGKSTLLSIVGLLDSLTTGTYTFAGQDVTAMDDRQLTAMRAWAVGFVFQAFHLLPYRSALENVGLGMLYSAVPARERRERARAAIERVGLSHRSHALPGQLSGGERQRVAIARAVVARPHLVLCDEPTGNLDTATSHEILDLLDDLHDDGHTVIVITHDHEVAARAERTLHLRDGRLSMSNGEWS